MATKISASQISGGTSGSWYARLKAVQKKYGATETTKNVTQYSKATADTMNTFIDSLNALSTNKYGSHIFNHYSGNKPARVTQYGKITESTTMTKINNILGNLEAGNANNNIEQLKDSTCAYNGTESTCANNETEATCGDNSTEGTCGDYSTNATCEDWGMTDADTVCAYTGDDGTNGDCQTNYQSDATCGHDSTCGNEPGDGTCGDGPGDGTCGNEPGDGTCGDYSTDSVNANYGVVV